MDGAAARGRLDIVRRLHQPQNEGCSRAAFIGAASNGHLQVLEWLYHAYPREVSDGREEAVAAAGNGHVAIVEFLVGEEDLLTRDDLDVALMAAAANGHVAVVRAFLRVGIYTVNALLAAATNGHAAVIELILGWEYFPNSWLEVPLQKAIERRHLDAILLLAEKAHKTDVLIAFQTAAWTVDVGLLKSILASCELDKDTLTEIFRVAVQLDRCAIVEDVLGKCCAVQTSCLSFYEERVVYLCGHFLHSDMYNALCRAVRNGRLDMVNILLKKGSVFAGRVLPSAVRRKQWAVAERLLRVCEGEQLREFGCNGFVEEMLTRAALTGGLELTQLILSKCGDLDVDGAFAAAVKNNCLEVGHLLVEKTKPSLVLEGLIDAAVKADIEMVKILLAFVDQAGIEKALEKTASSGSVAIASMLLARCNPGSHSHIFYNAAATGNTKVVQLLLDQMEQCSIDYFLRSMP